MPLLFSDNTEPFDPILKQEGFERLSIETAQRTLLIGLSKPLEELRKGLDQKWRNRLNFAEKKGLDIVEGEEDGLFAQFIEMYEEMHARKKFVKPNDVHQYRAMQDELPNSLKMRISIAYLHGKPVAGLVYSRIGDIGICLFAATSDAGLSTQGSYLLQWKTVGWLKENGAKWYDLAGISPETNPGTYRFKSGLCGKNGKDLHYMGTYVSHENSVADRVVRMANFTRIQYRRSRRIVNGLVYVPNGKNKQRETG
jgi:lipid II:glycine glycyltransferase (peptidoglycan interpeptide bridge formation enzyme)